MKISCIKQKQDDDNFRIIEKLGMNISYINNPEEVDEEIKKLVSQNYDTIILSNEIAGFSEDIIKKYKKNKDINIIITTRK
ncbi:MAG: hypothetical protein GX682_05910 [Clostridiaceae bacterium]|nr:hypothetical protein [Clostridiaceae bacterium]